MAEHEESLAGGAMSQEDAVHVRDYERFIRLFKYGAIICFIIGLIVLMIL